MPQDERSWHRPSRDGEDERDDGRGDWRGEQRGYRSRGYGEERSGSLYGGGREDHDSRQDRDYRGALRSGDHGRYEEEEGRDYPPRFPSGGRSGREYDEPDFSGRSRAHGGYGYGGGSGYGNSGSDNRGGGFATYTQDYDRKYASGAGSSGGHGRGERVYGNRDRDWWDRATDEVSSWFGDEDAERRRRVDRHRGRGPRNYTRSDERIREDVSDRLTDDPLVDASEIDVDVQSQEVTLSGTVASRNEKRLAEECAESASGVKHVQNNLRVKNRWSQSGNVSGTSGRFGGGSTTAM